MPEHVWVRRPDGWGEEAVDLHRCRRFLLAHPLWEQGDELAEWFLMPDGRWILHSALQDSEYKSGPNPGWDDRWQFENLVRVCYDFLFYRGALPPDIPELQELRSLGREIFGHSDGEDSDLTEGELIMHMAFHRMIDDMIFHDDHKICNYSEPEYWSKWYPHMARSSRRGTPTAEGKSAETSSTLKPKWDSESRTLHIGGRSWLFLKRGNAKNIEAVLDAFETKGWPNAIRNPFGLVQTLRDTKTYLNKRTAELKIPLRFSQSNLGLRCRIVDAGP
jgi:hypothetical protein